MRILAGGRSIVERIEEVLAMAKNGELEGIAIIFLSADNCTGTGWAFKEDTLLPHARIVAAVAMLQHRLLMEGI